MAKRESVRRRNRKLCAGDMNTRVCLASRDLTAPVFGSTNATMNLGENKADEVWASVNTTSGKQIHNGVGTDLTTLTHEVFIYFDPEVTSETSIVLADSRLLDIVRVENFEEQGKFLKLSCVERGLGEAAKA